MGIQQWIGHASLPGLLFVWNLLYLIQCADSPPVFIPYDIQARDLNWSGYNMSEIPKVLQKVTKVSSLDLSKNELIAIDPNVFVNLTQLEVVNLSENPNLIVPEDGCFLISNSIKVLNISYIPSIGMITNSTLSCLPNLTDLVFLLNRHCKAARSLFEGSGVKVSCRRGESTQYERDDALPTPSPRATRPTLPTGDPITPGPPTLNASTHNHTILYVVGGVGLVLVVVGVVAGICYYKRRPHGHTLLRPEDSAL